MSPAEPTSPLSESGFDSWHALHVVALSRIEAMDRAVALQDWTGVDEGSRWIYEVLRPHNESEEAELFPLLERCGAADLRHQLYLAHREMWDLNLKLLSSIDEGQVQDPRGVALAASALIARIRRHIEIEEETMLPLLMRQAPRLEDRAGPSL